MTRNIQYVSLYLFYLIKKKVKNEDVFKLQQLRRRQ